MPIVRDGEKFACKQCVQGHRVSGCNHIDRPLQHVNKKGRPVSQCPHCRGLRRARQTHIKCDCGERRHSRNASSESASLDEEGSCKCKCFLGKKCTCALKKEIPESEVSTPSPRSQRDSPMRWMPARRSESAIPSFRDVYQAQQYAATQPAQDLGLPFSAQRPYALGRSQHAGQRSVDSLPLSSSSTAAYQAPIRAPSYDHQFLNPDYGFQQLHIPQAPSSTFTEQAISDFPVQLDQSTIDKSLSPHNKKRYSMNDFSMLAGMSHHVPDSQLYPHTAGAEPHGFQFQAFSSQDFAFPSLTSTATQNPPPGSVASTDYVFPALSRSSSGTTSEPGDAVFLNPMANSSQPVITIDPSWGIHGYDASDEKTNFAYTPTSYQETPSEYSAAFDDPALPIYDMEGGNNGVNPFSTEPPSGGIRDFSFPGQEFGHGDSRNEFPSRGLPDRSTRNLSIGPQSPLDIDYRFPNSDLTSADSYAGSPLKQGWSPINEDVPMSPEIDSAN